MNRRDEVRDEGGTVTLWLLGVCMLLLALGGISVDLWRGFSARRSLANTADAAALAGASAIDEDAYRQRGVVQLDPGLAASRARAHVVRQLDAGALRDVDVHADRESITVVVDGRIAFTLLGVLAPGGDLPLKATAIATPRRAG
jgi:Flp pilus assembly protein TadG